MRVVFLEDVPNVAQAGDVREVATGFARNYLLPRKLAALATSEQLKRIEKLRAIAQEKRQKELKEMGAIAQRLEGAEVTLKAKVAPTGEFYGSISTLSIAQELSRLSGLQVERRMLDLPTPLSQPGTYEVTIRLPQGVSASVTVIAEAEE
ncbi:MAG: 50S ribosomal protein L9 [Dehalococcoidia bacterium]